MRNFIVKQGVLKLLVAICGMSAIVAFAVFYNNPNIETTASANPLEGRKIVVDAGHGGNDPGALRYKIKESVINLQVAKKLEEELIMLGAEVIMTRTDEKALGSSKADDMYARQKIFNRDDAELGISIHMNYISDTRVRGPMVFYHPHSEEGKKLAQMMQKALDESHGYKSRTAHAENFFVLRVGKCTAIMVECGFMSNPRDLKLLQSSPHQEMLAKTIANTVVQYFADKPLVPTPSPAPAKCCGECPIESCDGSCAGCKELCGEKCGCSAPPTAAMQTYSPTESPVALR